MLKIEAMPTKKVTIRKWYRLFFALLPIVSFIHTLMPFILKGFINRKLANADNLAGKVGAIRISFFRRLIRVSDVYIDKTDEVTGTTNDFFAVKELEIRFDWDTLWRGVLKCTMEVTAPEFHFIKPHKSA